MVAATSTIGPGRSRASGALRTTALVATGLLIVGSYLGGHLVYRGATGIDPSLLSAELREGHHHDGEGHEHPAPPPQHEPDRDHTHSHEDSHAR